MNPLVIDQPNLAGLQRLKFGGRKTIVPILQNEAAECGLACLVMIANFHGHQIDLASARRLSSISLRGANLHHLCRAASEFQLVARGLKLDLEQLSSLRLPCILHWNQSHFVVLTAVSKNSITIVDPARGQRTVGMEEVNVSFTGVALELTPIVDFQNKDERRKLKLAELFSRATGLPEAIAQVLVLSVVIQLLALISPYYLRLVLDDVVTGSDISFLSTIAVAFTLLLLFQSLVSTLRALITVQVANQLSMQVASNLFVHLLKLPISFFERRHIGDITSKFASLERIREQLTSTLVEAVIDGLLVITTLVLMWFYSPLLASVALAAVLCYVGLRLVFFHKVQTSTEAQITANARKDTSFVETVRAIQSIKLMGRESQRLSLWQNHFAESLNANIKVGHMTIAFTTLNQTLFGLERLLVIYLGAHLIIGQQFSVGMLMAFFAYKMQFTDKASGLIEKYQQMKLLRVHLDRVADIVHSEPERLSQQIQGEVSGELELKGLGFKYGKYEPYVFSNLNLKIATGESVAIVGESGNGKSTVLKLILGLLEPSEGEILVDGKSTAQGIATLREQMAAVMQDDAPISGTIGENISFFEAIHDEARIREAAIAANLHETIIKMPMQYQTTIGDQGTSLSGGQRQRLLLARALYRKPKIILLDEATSHLDLIAEKRVNAAIKEMKITRIFVAHRPETILTADRFIALKFGAFVELDRETVVQRIRRNQSEVEQPASELVENSRFPSE